MSVYYYLLHHPGIQQFIFSRILKLIKESALHS